MPKNSSASKRKTPNTSSVNFLTRIDYKASIAAARIFLPVDLLLKNGKLPIAEDGRGLYVCVRVDRYNTC
jgi:hypothetical protein